MPRNSRTRRRHLTAHEKRQIATGAIALITIVIIFRLIIFRLVF